MRYRSRLQHQTLSNGKRKEETLGSSVPPSKIHDLRYGMTVFATEGCAACHRLKGFQSNVGFAIEKDKEPTFDEMYRERNWFTSLFPEEALGSQIVKTIEDHSLNWIDVSSITCGMIPLSKKFNRTILK